MTLRWHHKLHFHIFPLKYNLSDDICYRESSPLRQIVEKCVGEFKRGHTSTNDAERSGKPKDATAPEIIFKNPTSYWMIQKCTQKKKTVESTDVIYWNRDSRFFL